MKIIKGYNKYILNEELDINTGKYNDSFQESDRYFANVKGNLAGAEFTLVGAAVLKLIGFIKRKGMQAYLATALKPRLGRVYLNGIIRYALKNQIGKFSRKKFFNFKKVENKEEVLMENRISFEKDGQLGLKVFAVGAKVTTEKPEPALVNGVIYLCVDNGIYFKTTDSIITNVYSTYISEEEKEDEIPDEEQTLDEVTDEELEIIRDQFEQDILKMGEGVEPSEDVLEDMNYIKETFNKIKTESSNGLNEDNKKILDSLIKELETNIDFFKKQGLEDINRLLSDPQTTNRLRLENDKRIYIANIKALIDLRDELKRYIFKMSKFVPAQPTQASIQAEPAQSPIQVQTEKIYTKYTDFLLEKTAIVKPKDISGTNTMNITNKPSKVGRYGDELLEIVKSGDAVDLNDPEFYKPFEAEGVRDAVSKEILTQKAELIKLQLTAERVISGNAKLDNNWKRMVEGILSLYSKFMNTETVNPYKLIADTGTSSSNSSTAANTAVATAISDSDRELNNVLTYKRLSENKLFNDSVTKSELNKISKNDYCLLNLSFKQGKTLTQEKSYILKRITDDKDNLKIFRLLGKVDLKKVSKDFKETDFTSLVEKTYPTILLPTFKQGNVDDSGKALRAIYIVANTQNNFAGGNIGNKVSLVYLFSTLESIDFTKKETYYFKIKSFKDTGYERVIDENFKIEPTDDVKNYKLEMLMDNIKFKITSIKSFGTFYEYDISSVTAPFDAFKKFFK